MIVRSVAMSVAVIIVAATVGAQSPGSPPAQQAFQTPQAAVDALLDACRNNDSAALIRMLGERYGKQLERIDDAEERRHRQDFYEKAQSLLEIEPEGDAKAVLVIGREHWPVPVPLVKDTAGWRFDMDAGFEEMLARRIGENELAAIDVCYKYPGFQVEYAGVDRNGDDVREYAQRLISSASKRDGLFWQVVPGANERPSPMESLLPDYFGDLKNCKPGTPYMGYYFKILMQQGPNPPVGKYDYVINGHMIAGFALVAWPSDYRGSGVMTFLISHQGKLFEKDLGPDTDTIVQAMTEYNPDDTWTEVTD